MLVIFFVFFCLVLVGQAECWLQPTGADQRGYNPGSDITDHTLTRFAILLLLLLHPHTQMDESEPFFIIWFLLSCFHICFTLYCAPN